MSIDSMGEQGLRLNSAEHIAHPTTWVESVMAQRRNRSGSGLGLGRDESTGHFGLFINPASKATLYVYQIH
jgi:hypothetical protein